MKEKINRTRWVHLRLTPSEYRYLQSRLQKTTCRKMSDYLRAVIFERPIVTTYRNSSIDAAMEEASILNRELNAIGNNINQIAKKMHTIQLSEIKSWTLQFDAAYVTLLSKVGEVKAVMDKLAGQWLR